MQQYYIPVEVLLGPLFLCSSTRTLLPLTISPTLFVRKPLDAVIGNVLQLRLSMHTRQSTISSSTADEDQDQPSHETNLLQTRYPLLQGMIFVARIFDSLDHRTQDRTPVLYKPSATKESPLRKIHFTRLCAATLWSTLVNSFS